MTLPGPLDIRHDVEASRFEARLDGCSAECQYQRRGDTLLVTHTAVPESHQGRGIAAQLVQALLDWARAEGLRVRPLCNYVAAYMHRNPATGDLLER